MLVSAAFREWAGAGSFRGVLQIVTRWFWDSAKLGVLENRSPLKCRSDYWLFVVESGISFFGRSWPKMPGK